MRRIAAALGLAVGLVGGISYYDRELGIALLAPAATVTAIFVAYEALVSQRPRLIVSNIYVPATFGLELGSGKSVGCYLNVVVVNLSRAGNAVLGIAAREQSNDQFLPLEEASIRSSDPKAHQTVYNVAGADWIVPALHLPRPTPIEANGVKVITASFFRLADVGGKHVGLRPANVSVRITDAFGRTYDSGLTAPQVIEPAAGPSISFIG